MAETKTKAKRGAPAGGSGAKAGKAEAHPVDTSAERSPDGEKPHVCSVAFCPIGMALTGVQQAGPEVLDHLLAAAREFFLAAKAVIDARAEDFEGGASDGGLERIEIA